MSFIESAWEKWRQSDDGRFLLETVPSPLTVKMIFVSGMNAGINAVRRYEALRDDINRPSDTEVAIAVARARELDAEARENESYFG